MLEPVRKAVQFSKRLRHTFVATAGREGLPHVAAGGEASLGDDGLLHVVGWYCPTTTQNLEDNRLVSLVFWDPETDFGYQLLGEVEDIREKAILDGYGPETKEPAVLPQVERELLVRVKEVCIFSHAPHTDRVLIE